jgi:hypothetical protein
MRYKDGYHAAAAKESRVGPRVRAQLLYSADGLLALIVDGELIDEVGYAFLARCESIRT